MSNYTPPYTITNQMIQLIAEIAGKVGSISVLNNLDARPHLRRNNRIKSIHASLAIEANSLSLSGVRDVIDGKPIIGPKQEVQEVKNAYEAYAELGKLDPFSIFDLLRIHGIMEKSLVTDAGRFRKTGEGVFNGDKCIFMAPPPDLVPSLMNELFAWMNTEKRKVHPLIMSAVFHYEFVFIHPFSDGNGRTARLLHTALLSQWNPIFEYIPLESQIEKFQEGYYNAIAACHTDGKSDQFIEFMLERINEILDEVSGQVQQADDLSMEHINALLEVMDFNVPYRITALMEKLGMSSRDTFRKNYLRPALNAGEIVMTIPDKPSSKNQRYMRK